MGMSEDRHVPMEQRDVFLRYEVVVDWAWEVVKKWPPLAIDTVGKQLIRAADSIGANLVEGDGRFSKADGLHFFIIARASARETRYWIRRAERRGLIPSAESTQKIEELSIATQLLNALIRYRRNRPQNNVVQEDPVPYSVPSYDLYAYTENLNT